ncbi:hypothetical protein D9757_015220 [Collybiopsis confluens]|uniref:Uncharacterized protein n=1 Tax=Collybiopsis confluens TaxID=2823264 RepID=A0A8H5CJM2_9AGAR|nr:hypothetical protein D9757_015220 [Collybiopsis confluens]
MPSIWREVKTLTIPSASNPGSIFEALLSPHAQYLAVASGHEVQIWDLRKALPNSENSQSSFSNEHLSVHKMSWCQGTTQLAIGHDKGLVSVLDIQEGVVWMEGFGLAEALVSPVSGLAWLSPVLLAVSMGSTVEIWRFESEYKGDDGQRSWSFCGRIPDPPIMANQTEPPLILTIHALADHQLLLQYPDGGGRTLIWNLTFGPFIARLSIVPWKLPHGINDVSAASGHALYTDHGSGIRSVYPSDSSDLLLEMEGSYENQLGRTIQLDRVEARQRKAKSVNPSSDNRGRTRKAKEKATVDEPEGPSIGAYPKSPAVRSASQDDDDQFREQPESPLTPIGESPNSNNEQGPNPFNFESINLASTHTPTLSFDYPSIFSSWFQSSFPNLNLSHSISSTSHPILQKSKNMSNRNNIPQIGLPTLSNDAVTQLAAAAEKLPKLYKTPPILNIEDPVGVIQWFEAAEWIFDSNGIKSDDAKLKLALDWSTYPTRKLFMGMKSVRTPNYDEFVKEVRNILPEEMLDVAGSMYELDRIVNEYEPLSIRQKAEFRLYNVLFVTECEKLMTDRPILANRDAVRTYLKVFEESTRSMVFDQVRRDVKPATIGNRRKEDPITLKEAVAAAEKVFSLSNYESIYGLTSVRSSGIGSTNPESYRRSQIAYPLTSGLPAQSNFDYLKSVRKIKQENDVEGGISDLWKSASKDSVNEKEKLEFEKERLASQQDVNEAWLKEMRQMTLKVGEGLSTVASLVGAAVSQRQPNLEGNQNRYGFNQSGPSGSSARYGNTYSNTGPRQLLCFMCRAKDHLLAACPIYQDYVKRGWLVPEGNGSTRMKLRDEVRMPRDDENTPRYKLIEDIAKARGWGKAESYFANMVDEEEDEMNRQLDSEDQVQVLLRELAEAKNAMLQMSHQRPSEELGKKLLDSMKEPRPGRGIYQIGRNHASSFVQAPESSFSKKPNNTNNDRRGPPPGPLKSAFKKKVAFDGVLMPPRDRFDGIPNRNFRRTRDTSTEIESEPAEKVRTEVVSKEQPSAGYGDIRPSPATAKRPFDDVRPITFRPPPETDVRNRRSEVPNSQALDQSQPSPMSEEREKSKQPSYRVRNELFKDGLAEEVATKVLEGTVQLSIEEMLGISSLVKKILERKLKNRRVEPKRGKSAYVAVLTDNGETEIPEMPTGVLMRGNYIDIDDLALEPEIMFEYLSEARDGMPIGSWTIKICPIL